MQRAVEVESQQSGRPPQEAPEPGVDPELDRRLEVVWLDPCYALMIAAASHFHGLAAAFGYGHESLWQWMADGHEVERIVAAAPGDEAAQHRLLRLAAVATLAGGLRGDDLEHAAQLECEDSGAPPAEAAALIEALRRLLPAARGGAAASELGGVFLEAAFARSGTPVERQVRLVLRAASFAPEATAARVQPMGDNKPTEATAAWLDALIEAGAADPRIEETLLAAPSPSKRFLEVAERRIARLRSRPATVEDRRLLAETLGQVSVGLTSYEEPLRGLPAAEEAVEVYRWLAAQPSRDFRVPLASALEWVGCVLRKSGAWDRALIAAEEVVALERELAAFHSPFRVDLSDAIFSLAEDLSALGRRQEAAARAKEALAIVRSVAAEEPEDSREWLSVSLEQAADRLDEADRDEEAMALYRESVEVEGRFLAEVAPKWGPLDLPKAGERIQDFARSQILLASWLGDRQRPSEALVWLDRAAEVQRTWLADHPQDEKEFDPVEPLDDRVDVLLALGCREEALAQAEAVARICRERRSSFNRICDWGAAERKFAQLLSESGRHDAALREAEWTIDACRSRLAQDRDAASELIEAFEHRIDLLAAAGRGAEALAESEATARFCREAVAEDPGSRQAAAEAMRRHAHRLSAVGRNAEALAEAEAALKLLASERGSGSYCQALAMGTISRMLRNLGRRDEAAATVEAALDRWETVEREKCYGFVWHRNEEREKLVDLCIELGRAPKAVAHREAAVRTYRRCMERRKGRIAAWGGTLAEAILKLAADLDAVGKGEEALAHTIEAVAVLREVVVERPSARADLAEADGRLADRLIASGRLQEALPHAAAAVEGFCNLPIPQAEKRAAAVQRLEMVQKRRDVLLR